MAILMRWPQGRWQQGGTLGILIPPSVILVIFAILVEANIAKLFIAAIIPGIIAAIGYMITIRIYVHFSPKSAGQAPRVSYQKRFKALFDIWPVLLIFFVVIGGIYSGIFTPTEGAAIGAIGTGLIAAFGGFLNWKTIAQAILETASSSAMIFFDNFWRSSV